MEKKCFVRVTFCLIMAMMLVTGLNGTSYAAAKITVRIVAAWPKAAQFETQQFVSVIESMQKEADQKYPGQIYFDFKGAGEVIPTQQQVEALRSGMVDMILTAASYYTSIMPEVDVMSLSVMKPWEERQAGVYDYLEKLHNAKANAHFMSRLGSGDLFHIFLAKQIQKIDDFKGMKIRVSPTHIPFIRSLGAEPVVTPPAEIYTAMERSVVSGYVQPVASIRTMGLLPVTKYMVRPGFYIPTIMVLVNLDFWKKLPDPLKDFMNEGFKKGERTVMAAYEKKMQTELEAFKKAGVTIIQLSPAEAKKFSKMAEDGMMETVLKKAPEEGKRLYEMVTKK
ncbi:MAG: TRAP transporter substrate-binding protein DctP [Syntrophorhabdaceae bacterium]|nr:TRAP transporter substrate-binding protein DctP [Syntrophorhabdaceae bacterium]